MLFLGYLVRKRIIAEGYDRFLEGGFIIVIREGPLSRVSEVSHKTLGVLLSVDGKVLL